MSRIGHRDPNWSDQSVAWSQLLDSLYLTGKNLHVLHKAFFVLFLSFHDYISIQPLLSSNDNPYFSNFANLQVDDSGKHIPQLKPNFIFCTIDIPDRKDPPRSFFHDRSSTILSKLTFQRMDLGIYIIKSSASFFKLIIWLSIWRFWYLPNNFKVSMWLISLHSNLYQKMNQL